MSAISRRQADLLLIGLINLLLLKPLNELKVIFPAVCTGRSRSLSISSTETAALYQVVALHNHECGARHFKCSWSDGGARLCDPS